MGKRSLYLMICCSEKNYSSFDMVYIFLPFFFYVQTKCNWYYRRARTLTAGEALYHHFFFFVYLHLLHNRTFEYDFFPAIYGYFFFFLLLCNTCPISQEFPVKCFWGFFFFFVYRLWNIFIVVYQVQVPTYFRYTFEIIFVFFAVLCGHFWNVFATKLFGIIFYFSNFFSSYFRNFLQLYFANFIDQRKLSIDK